MVRDAALPAPTFAEYIAVVRAAVTDGTRRVYGSYWNRIVEHWGSRRLDEPTPSEINQLAEYAKTHVVARRNARGGRSAAEHSIAALRCVYRHAENDGHIKTADSPALKVTKPRRLPSTRRAVPDTRLAEINEIAATTGNDPALDTLLLRLHTETRAEPCPNSHLMCPAPDFRQNVLADRGRERLRRLSCQPDGWTERTGRKSTTRNDGACATVLITGFRHSAHRAIGEKGLSF